MMSTGYYNADGLWVAAYEQHQEERRLDSLVTTALFQRSILDINNREFMLEHGYDPDTGEYQND